MNRAFTGRHMLIVMVAFFATVIAVNVAMAVAATRTFGGKVVENSYVAGQQFNGWLREAREQRALGWNPVVDMDRDRHVILVLQLQDGGPLGGAEVGAVARHPVGREADAEIAFLESGGGVYRSARPLPVGRWLVHFDIAREGRRLRFIENVS